MCRILHIDTSSHAHVPSQQQVRFPHLCKPGLMIQVVCIDCFVPAFGVGRFCHMVEVAAANDHDKSLPPRAALLDAWLAPACARGAPAPAAAALPAVPAAKLQAACSGSSCERSSPCLGGDVVIAWHFMAWHFLCRQVPPYCCIQHYGTPCHSRSQSAPTLAALAAAASCAAITRQL